MGSEIKLKLLINPTTTKVVWAEAHKDFVDFLFGLLGLPLGTILGTLHPELSGPAKKIYNSVKNIRPDYFQPNQTKTCLLHPAAPTSHTEPSPLLQMLGLPHSLKQLNSVKGYMKDDATYMVADDLTVMPLSILSAVSLMKSFNIQDSNSLKVRTVDVDMAKGKKLLEFVFGSNSSTVMTDVFVSVSPDSGSAAQQMRID